MFKIYVLCLCFKIFIKILSSLRYEEAQSRYVQLILKCFIKIFRISWSEVNFVSPTKKEKKIKETGCSKSDHEGMQALVLKCFNKILRASWSKVNGKWQPNQGEQKLAVQMRLSLDRAKKWLVDQHKSVLFRKWCKRLLEMRHLKYVTKKK